MVPAVKEKEKIYNKKERVRRKGHGRKGGVVRKIVGVVRIKIF